MHRYLWHSILAASVLGATSVALAQTAKETLPEPPAAQEQMQPPASGEAMPEVMPQSKSPGQSALTSPGGEVRPS